jgi:hypothetical protein
MKAANSRISVRGASRFQRRQFLAAVASAAVASTGAGLPLTAAESAARWPDERTLGPFHYHADYSLTADTRLLNHIARLHVELPAELAINGGDSDVHVYLFSRQSTYEKYLGMYFDNVPKRRALYIKQGGPGMVFAYRSRDFATDVRHETTHAVLHNALPMVPLWMDEGLAEYYEVARDDRYAKNPHLRAVIRNAGKHELPSLSKLESINDLAEMGTREYQQAFAWMHFCLHGQETARQTLQAYLVDISRHRPPGRFAERIRKSMPDVEYQFFAHYRRMAAV